jgi:hypothetical protein
VEVVGSNPTAPTILSGVHLGGLFLFDGAWSDYLMLGQFLRNRNSFDGDATKANYNFPGSFLFDFFDFFLAWGIFLLTPHLAGNLGWMTNQGASYEIGNQHIRVARDAEVRQVTPMADKSKSVQN